MNFTDNIKNLFGVDIEAEQLKEETILFERKEEYETLVEIKTFFDSKAGKLLLKILLDEEEAIRTQLEGVSHEDLLKVQANLKALKMFNNTLDGIGSDIKSFEQLIFTLSKE